MLFKKDKINLKEKESNPHNLKITFFKWLIAILFSLIFFGLSYFFYFWVKSRVNRVGSCIPFDPLFQILPAINLYGLIKAGIIVVIILFLYGVSRKFYRLPYIIFLISFWWLGRIISMSSTIFAVPNRPIGPSGFIINDFLDRFIPNGFMSFGQDFMFSGHVGIPFLGFCIFYQHCRLFTKTWFRKNWLSSIFFLWSLFQSIVLELSRAHYTVDILVAWGMTFALFSLGRLIFRPVERLGEKLEQLRQ